MLTHGDEYLGDVCPLSAYQTGRACHSVQGTAEELARDLNIDPARCVTVAQVSTIWRFTWSWSENRRRQLCESLPGTAGGL